MKQKLFLRIWIGYDNDSLIFLIFQKDILGMNTMNSLMLYYSINSNLIRYDADAIIFTWKCFFCQCFIKELQSPLRIWGWNQSSVIAHLRDSRVSFVRVMTSSYTLTPHLPWTFLLFFFCILSLEFILFECCYNSMMLFAYNNYITYICIKHLHYANSYWQNFEWRRSSHFGQQQQQKMGSLMYNKHIAYVEIYSIIFWLKYYPRLYN